MDRFARNASQIFVLSGLIALLLLVVSAVVGQVWLMTVAAVFGGVCVQAWMTMKASSDSDG